MYHGTVWTTAAGSLDNKFGWSGKMLNGPPKNLYNILKIN